MRPELQAKLLQYLNKKQADAGFTLVELLVVVIIIGILAAIALPSYLNLTASSKQSEARQNTASINHAQQVFATENSTGFATTFDQLAIGVVKGTGAYSTSVYNYKMAGALANSYSTATPLTDSKLKRYAGAVNSFQNNASQQSWDSVVCEANAANVTGSTDLATAITSFTLATATGEMGCPTGSAEVKVAGK